MSNRREFAVQLCFGAGALLSASAFAAAPMVDEKDPAAAGLGYKADAAGVDKAKFPKFAAGQNCSGCALYQGKAGDAAGGCPAVCG